MSDLAYLQHSLRILAPYLKRKNTVEVCLNRPGEVWLEDTKGAFRCIKDAALNSQALRDLARNLATATGQVYHPATKPMLSAVIPELGYRMQIVSGAMVDGGFALTVRIGAAKVFALEDFALEPSTKKRLLAALAKGETLLVSGGTSTGKTSFVNALLQHLNPYLRLVLVEDVQELQPPHPNIVRLVKSKTGTDSAQISFKDIINCCMRLRPDRIILGELDLDNSAAFLRLLNTGHGGSLSTIHADSPTLALAALTQNLRIAGWHTQGEVDPLVSSAVRLVVQLTRSNQRNLNATLWEGE